MTCENRSDLDPKMASENKLFCICNICWFQRKSTVVSSCEEDFGITTGKSQLQKDYQDQLSPKCGLSLHNANIEDNLLEIQHQSQSKIAYQLCYVTMYY